METNGKSALAGKRALVTGASRGIGAAVAKTLAAAGADVAITYERSADRAADVVRAIEGLGRKGLAIKADSADAAAAREAVQQAAKAFGGLDILVNNAGVARGGPLEAMSLEDIDAVLNVNIRGVVLTTQAAIPLLSEGGRIINMGSCLAERVTMPGISIYAMSKSAMIALTKGLARDLAPRNITVNVVHPGPTDTDMNPADGPMKDAMLAGMARQEFGTAQDIADMVAFLAGPSGRQITGAGFTVDGGLNA
ncbi:SDR family oxidoreductase [Aquabacter spiritensis]|uniref:NAD(P)-dependent dehydrogenase (Short-subunit alcohol dehydrogenase family) n=1 Tax=Aquabacter spiritensis TaxID=933073 RepID=A0A4R3M224_9HYPH|nr:SDR family oxidoreductase [Aquabacter spiritensis]TCT05237.1 NAD(P)-dependent dehydrogenase (short-subunit alcohol dehydrogenase family) [Aquabacter spiritensis]